MTGSVALDVVIGLVFIYLLYSLLATVLCEIVASYWGLRARNLLYAIGRMLEDSPKQSETKILALLKQVKDDLVRLFDTPEGPASCVFYRLPVIKYLAKNTFQSKPSYITRQTFSKALIEIFRNYGGDDTISDLEKIRKVLAGSLEHNGVLKLIRDEIVRGTKVEEGQKVTSADYEVIYDKIVAIVGDKKKALAMDATQSKLLRKIRKRLKGKPSNIDRDRKKEIIYEIDKMLNLFGHETRSHLRSLLKDANDDLVKFRLNLEQWFDDTMDRAAGWYKQRIQFVLLIIGLGIALCFNANTIDIVHKLSVDKDARDKMIQVVGDYLNDSERIQPARSTLAIPVDSSTRLASDTLQSLASDSIQLARIDSLKKVQQRLQKQIEDANSLVGAGWPELPETLSLLKWTRPREDSLSKLAKDDMLHYSVIALDTVIKSGTFEKRILVYPAGMTKAVLACLDEASFWGEERYRGFNAEMTRIKVETGLYGTILYMVRTCFSKAFWGFFLTAIAISLGAPFWFDMLNKLMQVRGSVKESTHTQVSIAPATGQGTVALASSEQT